MRTWSGTHPATVAAREHPRPPWRAVVYRPPVRGKSTVAGALKRRVTSAWRQYLPADGDNVRYGLCRDLGFSDADRRENIRRCMKWPVYGARRPDCFDAFISSRTAPSATGKRARRPRSFYRDLCQYRWLSVNSAILKGCIKARAASCVTLPASTPASLLSA